MASNATARTLDVPRVYRVECGGELGNAVGPHDVGLYVAAQFGVGGAAGAVLELAGPAVASWDDDGRRALMETASLCGPGGVRCGPAEDAGADACFRYDFSTLAPYYGAWTAAGFDAGPVAGKAAAYVSRVVIAPPLAAGDVWRAAAVLRGRQVHSDVALWLVAPAAVIARARGDGSLAAWEDAGATAFLAGEAPWREMLTSAGVVATTTRAVFESCRDRGVPAYLVNPTTAAAAALAGELTDPTPLCGIISE